MEVGICRGNRGCLRRHFGGGEPAPRVYGLMICFVWTDRNVGASGGEEEGYALS